MFKHLSRLSSKLGKSDRAPKTNWSIINRFSNNKKISVIPPAFFEGKVVFDFEKKPELFKNNLASQ